MVRRVAGERQKYGGSELGMRDSGTAKRTAGEEPAVLRISRAMCAGERLYAAGSAGAEPVNCRCAIAAMPINPPIPIDSTAVEGTIIIAPFSFSPS